MDKHLAVENNIMHSKGPTWFRPKGGQFKIRGIVLQNMLELVQDDPRKPESGGILLGRHILDTDDIVVDQITIPMQGDTQSRFRFMRARWRHQQVIDRAWKESNGTCTYLGEWHTHPESVPSPSVVDKCDWKRKLLVDRFSSYLFFVIVGIDEIRVWEGQRHSTRLSALTLGDRTD